MSEVINVTIGAKSPKKDCILYFGGYTSEGFIYKDLDTYNNSGKRNEICYIAECGFDGKDFLTDDEAVAEIRYGGADTHNSLFEGMKNHLIDLYGEDDITDEFVENCCEYCIEECEWTCLSTFYIEVDWTESLEDYKQNHK